MEFLILKQVVNGLKLETLSADDEASSLGVMQGAVDGRIEHCGAYFDHLPKYVDAWCNEECLFRPDLKPILVYEFENRDHQTEMGLLKGNILFTATDEAGEGETVSLSQDQMDGIVEALRKMEKGIMSSGSEDFPVFHKVFA